MDVNSEDYQNHILFIKLDELISFYDWWSYSIMLFMTSGTTSVLNIDTYVYSSMKGTLESIKIILKNGQINDAYALIRKFHDSIIMNVYTNLYLSQNLGLENLIVMEIDGWLKGTTQLPNFRKMTNFIKDNTETKQLYQLINVDDRYDRIRERGNNNTHYNFYRNVMLNDNKVYNKDRMKYLETIHHDINHLVIMHLAYIFLLEPHYMMSSDYIDHKDCGLIPPKNSEFWVAPAIQKIFDDIVKVFRPDLANYIKSNCDMDLI